MLNVWILHAVKLGSWGAVEKLSYRDWLTQSQMKRSLFAVVSKFTFTTGSFEIDRFHDPL